MPPMDSVPPEHAPRPADDSGNGAPFGGETLEALLMAEHEPIEDSLRRHRLALMRGDMPQARESYRTFRDLLLGHLEFEDDHVLPAYARVWDGSNESPPRQFELEHGKLRRILDDIGRRLQVIDGTPIERLDLLDAETFLRSLVEHHDLREGRVLYPLLTRLLDDEAKNEIRRQFERSKATSTRRPAANRESAPPTS